jgi:hypothetical protein
MEDEGTRLVKKVYGETKEEIHKYKLLLYPFQIISRFNFSGK